MIHNPFPGPQPYRSSDRDRFYGRDEMSARLERSVLAHRCVTVYGPSGAGKSSLVQASAIPSLIDAHEIDVVRVDAWPADIDPTGWLADAMHTHLDLGPRPGDPQQAIRTAAQRVARRSPNLMLIYLDQVEQLLYPSRSIAEIEAFFDCMGGVVELPLRNLRVLLTLREDYLGRFRDRLRAHRRLLDHGFRVGPLTVGEISAAVCQAAAAGQPPQTWEFEPTRSLMLQVRAPGQTAADEAEAQAAYAQIVCRALFQRRADSADASGELNAETVLRDYFETTISALGPLRGAAQRLLEDHLVSADGSRTLRTEKELLRILPEKELTPALGAVGGGLLALASSDYDATVQDLQKSCALKCAPDTSGAYSRSRWENGIGIGSLVVGGAALLVGSGMVILNLPQSYRSKDESDVKVDVVPLVSASSAGLSTRLTF